MDPFAQAVNSIVHEQEAIIGPVALEQAQKVAGLKMNDGQVSIEGDKTAVLESLVKQYEQFFGQASVEVCKEAVGTISELPQEQLPAILR